MTITWISILTYLAIFAAKMVEVALATVRNVLINRGEKLYGACVGFFEVLIWVIVVSNVLGTLSEDPFKVIVFCLAFSCGNYLGVIVEGKLALGTACIQVVMTDEGPHGDEPARAKLKKDDGAEAETGAEAEPETETETKPETGADADAKAEASPGPPAMREDIRTLLRKKGFGVTTVEAQGYANEVHILMIYLKRKRIPEALELIRANVPAALVTVNDVRQIRNGFIKK